MNRRFYPISKGCFKEHIYPYLLEFKDGRGRPPLITDYDFFCAVLFVMRTGIAWRDLPVHYGCWHTIYTIRENKVHNLRRDFQGKTALGDRS